MLNKNIAFLGIMSALAAILQISAGIIPILGHLLSSFSTLPMIFSARLGGKQGILTYFSSTLIILFIQPAEVPIFLFTTGLLGLTLGLTSYYRCSFIYSSFISATSLTTGMLILSISLAIPIFGGITVNYILVERIVVYFLFSLSYTLLWKIFYKKIIKSFLKNQQ